MRLRWCALLLVTCAALLQGCAVSRVHIRQANAIVAATAGKWAELVSDGATSWVVMAGN